MKLKKISAESNRNFQTGDTTLVDAAFRVPGKSFLMDDANAIATNSARIANAVQLTF